MFRVAIVQKTAFANEPEKNLKKAVQWICEAKKQGADVVLFPEMWSNGYAPPFAGAFENPFCIKFAAQTENWKKQAVTKQGEYIQKVQKMAQKENIAVLITCLQWEKEWAKPRNTAILIDHNGKVVLEYAKVHTCDFSLEALLENGTEFLVSEILGVKIGVMICYDREFPESARVLMLKGAEIVLVPNACEMNPARIEQLRTRAFENMVGVAMANYPQSGWGQSCAFSPIVFDENGTYCDNAILMASETEETIFVAEFDMEAIRKYRETETWGNAYRKPKAYPALLSEEVEYPFVRNKKI